MSRLFKSLLKPSKKSALAPVAPVALLYVEGSLEDILKKHVWTDETEWPFDRFEKVLLPINDPSIYEDTNKEGPTDLLTVHLAQIRKEVKERNRRQPHKVAVQLESITVKAQKRYDTGYIMEGTADCWTTIAIYDTNAKDELCRLKNGELSAPLFPIDHPDPDVSPV